ncbi:MAG: AMP-binding protein [Clostridia bacterium]|nr:AMP-binding protein [Clostridia bacterium]
MIDFFKNMERVFRDLGNKTALRMDDDKGSMTYSELDTYSGKAYRFLKENGIGREDVVMICLPRGIMSFAVMLGVWKAGAAFVVSEVSAAKERNEYIRKDCGCKCFLDEKLLSEIMAGESLSGRETIGPHDLAYIIYTSGSTGNPKGVMHEFGGIDRITPNKRCEGKDLFQSDTVAAINSSLSFIATMLDFADAINHAATLVLISDHAVRNIPELMRIYENTGVTITFMTPSLYRTCKTFNTQMKTVMLGGEPCCGLFNDRIRLVSAYSLSEAGRMLCTFPVDRPYERTPVGKNQSGEEIFLLGEDGVPVHDGEPGEICFRNEYMRGYHHLPEMTKKAFAGGAFHTGDIAVRNADGDLVILGRNDDMIKINGNRVEPEEAATAVREILGLSWCAARGFVKEDGRAYFCVYYLKGNVFDEDALREKLRERLPSYMIPAYFIAVDEIPLLPTGKLDRRALPEPSAESVKGQYEPPANDLEAKIIAEMEKTLAIGHISRHDSFRRMGGDSVAAMMIASALTDVIPEASYILTYDTPAEIAMASLAYAAGADRTVHAAELADAYEITTGTYFFYPGSFGHAFIECEIRLTEPIVPDCLQTAAEELLQELPFLTLTLRRAPDDSRYLLVPCDAPFRIIHRNGYVPPFSEEARGYLFTLSYDADKIRMMMSHGLTDGMGAKTATGILLENYLQLKDGGAAADKNTRKTFDYADPFVFLEKCPEPQLKIPYACPKTLAFEESEMERGKQKNSMISFSMASALAIARNTEGSVQAILMIALGEAIRRASGGKKKDLTISCPMDIRSRLGCTGTLRNCTLSYKFNISERLTALAFPDRLSAVKGMQYIQDMPDFWIPKYRSELAFTRMLAAECPTIRAKNDLLAAGSGNVKVGYPVVSFLGDFGLDRIAGRIRSVRCMANVEGYTGVILFAYIIRGRCYVSICSNVIDDSWKAHFIGILRDAGLDVTDEDGR